MLARLHHRRSRDVNGRAIHEALTGVGILVLLGALAYIVAAMQAC